MGQENEIVFEDLHGVHEEQTVTVDLDAGSKEDGITRAPAGQAADDDDRRHDDVEIDELRSADRDADEQVVDNDDASKASEDDAYSKKVKSRIQRATRATTKERERGDYWENQARKYAKDNYDSEKRTAENVIERADSQLEDTQTQLEKAIEDGDTKGQVKLTTQLTDQKAARVRAEVSLENLSPDGNVQPFSGKVDPASSKDPKKSDTWMEERSDWYGARGFERQTRLANRIDKEVFADGYSPENADYFEELDRRLKEKEPSLYEALDDADDTGKDDDPDKTRGKRGKNVVAPVSGNENSRQRTSGSKIDLSEDDFANMRRFGLDPNDPEVLKEYARNKREDSQGAR